MTAYEHIAAAIVAYQKKKIGPVALMLATRVHGLELPYADSTTIKITGSPQMVINDLVSKFQYLWGNLGVLESREAAATSLQLLKGSDIPSSLQNNQPL